MEKEYFYTLDFDDNENHVSKNKVSIEDINHLTLYMIENVEPDPIALSKIEGIITACSNNDDNNKDFPYRSIFQKMKYGFNSEFLFINIALMLFEKEFRKSGTTESTLEEYNKLLDMYTKKLKYDQVVYGELYNNQMTFASYLDEKLEKKNNVK